MNRHFISFISFLLLTSFALADELHLYVSPKGDDSAAGTEAEPLATLQGARDALRVMRKDGTLKPGTPVRITFKAGSYPIMTPIEFSAEDSGTADAPVTFEADRASRVRFTGSVPLEVNGQLVTDEKILAKLPEAARKKVRVWDLPALGLENVTSDQPNGAKNPLGDLQLIVNDKPQTLARWPNGGFLDVAGIPEDELAKVKEARENQKDYRTEKFQWKADPETDAHIAKWIDEAEPRAAGFWKYNWAGDMISLGEIDLETRTITPLKPGSGYGYGPITNAWYGFNLLCELDAPGEYYFDRATGKLYYYWPLIKVGNPAVTLGTDLLRLNQVSFVNFNGIIFENCRGTALKINGGEAVHLTSCIVRNTGMNGIQIDRGQNHRVAGCDVSYIDWTGISVYAGDPKTLTHCGHVIENNHIHHFSCRQMTYNPAVRVGGCGVTVSHNLIHEGPHTAVLFGGREHQFLENEVHSVCLNSGEMGAFYCGRDFTLVGNVMDGNYVHDIYNPRGQRNRAYMLDDGAAGLTIRNSWIENVAEGISLSAVGNVIENCTFVNCQPAISCWQKWENPETDYTNPGYTHAQLLTILASVPVNESPWIDRYPWLAQLQKSIDTKTLRSPETRTAIRNNRAINCADPWIMFMMGERYAYSEKTWLVEKNEVENLPADKIPTYTGKAGVYDSPERKTWPVHHEVNVGCGKLTFEK